MANELVINHPTGSTLYALLFNGTGQIYNGATFGAPDSASWTDYDIAMTEATTATGIYRADMPAVAAGVYGWVVRKQAGANPAVSDTTVGAGSIRWTGTAEETVPAAVNVTMQAGVLIPGPLALEATAQAILEDTGTTLPGLLAALGSPELLAEAVADAVLLRDWTAVTGTVPDRSTLNALRFLRNKWAASGGTLTVYKEDDETTAWEALLTTNSSSDRITGSTPE